MNLPEAVLYVIDQIMQAGGQAYLVGGALRDHLLGRAVTDYDIATSLSPEMVENVFQHEKTYPSGKRFGTITVAAGGLTIEVTTFRKESGYSDSRHPDQVTFVSEIVPDLSRRDFTINAMAFNPRMDSGLIDPFLGAEDLKRGMIRAVGFPQERFEEDPLRILRGIRFAAQLDFDLEEETKHAIVECKQLLKHVSRERVRDELSKLLLSPHPDKGILLLQTAGILPILLKAEQLPTETSSARSVQGEAAPVKNTPVDTEKDEAAPDKAIPGEITPSETIPGLTTWKAAVLTEKEVQIIKNLPAELDYRLAALLSMLFSTYISESMPQLAAQSGCILQSLRLDRKCINHVECLVKNYSRFCSMEMTPYQIRKLLGELHLPDMKRILYWYKATQTAFEDADMDRKYCTASRLLDTILEDNDPVFLTDLAINGESILQAGIGTEDGRLVGEALHRAYEWVLQNPENNHSAFLIGKLKKQFSVL